MYAVVGATGNTGKLIASHLLAKGKKVRVIGRSAERLRPFVAKGAEAFTAASMEDRSAMERAFQGVQAVYFLVNTPTVLPDWRKLGRTLGGVLQRAGVSHLVVLGSFAAHLPRNTGHYSDYYNLEQSLNETANLNILHLRPNFFMDNLFRSIPEIKSLGTISTAFRSDVSAPHIATRDIAAAAANALEKLEFTGKSSLELLGERDLTMNEIAATVSKAVGKPVRHVQLSYEDMARRLMSVTNVAREMADNLAQMYATLNEGRVTWPNPPAIKTTTSIEAFVAEEFIPRYKAG